MTSLYLPALTTFLPVFILGGLLGGLLFRAADLRRLGRPFGLRCSRCGYWLGEHHRACPNKWRENQP